MKRFAFLFILFLTLAGLVLPKAAHAQTAGVAGTAVLFNPNIGPEEHAKIVNKNAKEGTTGKEIWGDNFSTVVMDGMTCKIGICGDPTDPSNVYGPNNSAIVAVGSGVTAMYANPPADLALWIRDTGQTLGFIPKQAYAQGIGFTGLSALLPLWKVFRNIAYFLLAIVMIVIGFMVMFRKKIDPKTVVTVQNAIPKIVLALILITFSYAIVGLMVDLMYLVIFLLVGMFTSSGLLPNPATAVKVWNPTNQALFSQGSLLANVENIFGLPVVGGGITAPLKIFYQALGFDPNFAGGVSAVSGVVGIALAIGTTNPWGLLAALPLGLSVVAALLLSIAILFLVIRLLIFFLSAYIQIIIALIFGPIQLVMEALPGSTAFADWMKNLFANLIVFPIGAGAFMLSAIFANMANGTNTQLWNPPMTTLVPSSSRSISALLAIGILFAIPSIAGGIKEAIKSKPFINAGPEGIVGSFNQPIGLAMQGFQIWRSEESIKAMRGLSPGLRDTQPPSSKSGGHA